MLGRYELDLLTRLVEAVERVAAAEERRNELMPVLVEVDDLIGLNHEFCYPGCSEGAPAPAKSETPFAPTDGG